MQSTNRIDTGMAADPAWQGMQYRVQPVYGASRPASHLVRQAPGTMRSNPPPGADTMPRLIPLHPTHPIDPRLARCAWQWLVLGLLLSDTLPEARGSSRTEERRGGKQGVSKCRSRWSPDDEKTKTQ